MRINQNSLSLSSFLCTVHHPLCLKLLRPFPPHQTSLFLRAPDCAPSDFRLEGILLTLRFATFVSAVLATAMMSSLRHIECFVRDGGGCVVAMAFELDAAVDRESYNFGLARFGGGVVRGYGWGWSLML
ncbi:hypothetical protein QQ045_031088 [Rhodiola kirilowii]